MKYHVKTLRELREILADDDAIDLVDLLDDLKGSRAVLYALKILQEKGHGHTLKSMQRLIEEGM